MIEQFSILGVVAGVGFFCAALFRLGQTYRMAADHTRRVQWYALTVMITGFLFTYLFFIRHLSTAPFDPDIDLVISGLLFGGAIFTLLVAKAFYSTTQEILSLLAEEEKIRVILESESDELQEEISETRADSTEARAQLAEETARGELLDRQRIEARMIANQRLEGVNLLAAGIAHDFNNLLVGILGNASYAKDIGPTEEEEYREALDDVEVAAERAADLTRQLAAYCGKSVDVLETADLNVMISEVLTLMRSIFGSKVEVQRNLAPGLPLIWGDTSRFRQLLMNLVKNGCEAVTAQTGVLVIRTQSVTIEDSQEGGKWNDHPLTPGEYVKLTVVDNGCGIPESELPKLFEPFYSKKGIGRGLGLAAVGGIVRSHGGAIDFESTEGEGTTVQVLLPVANLEEEEEKSSLGEVGERPVRKGTLLIVDDEPIVLDMVRRGLERAGHKVQLVSNGIEFRNLLENESLNFAAAILDITMPDIAFDEVFNQIRSRFPTLPILVSSGYTNLEILDITGQDENVSFMSKPYRVDELTKKVAELGAAPD